MKNRSNSRRCAAAIGVAMVLVAAVVGAQEAGTQWNITLRDGDNVVGAITTTTLRVVTGYAGTIPIRTAHVAAVRFDDDPGGQVSIATIFGDAITGFLVDRSINLRLADRSYDVMREDFLSIEPFGEPRAVVPRAPTDATLHFYNGDRISGQLDEATRIESRFGAVAIPQLAGLAFRLSPELAVTARLIDGQQMRVDVEPVMLEFATRIGHSLEVAQAAVSSIRLTASASASLDDVHASFHERFADITDLIPYRWDFRDGEHGDNISDGGNDMFDGGNYLGTDLGTLMYTGGEIVDSPACGPGGRYFTSKVPGLFLFAAEIDQISNFQITGNLGADGGGAVDGLEFTVNGAAGAYRAFVKRVYGSGDPSVNHLIIVPEGGNLQQQFPNDTYDDDHIVTGLETADRIYYLLLSSDDYAAIDEEVMGQIARTFVEIAGL